MIAALIKPFDNNGTSFGLLTSEIVSFFCILPTVNIDGYAPAMITIEGFNDDGITPHIGDGTF